MSFIQIAIETISDNAKISASHDDFVTLFCLYEFQSIGPLPKVSPNVFGWLYNVYKLSVEENMLIGGKK